MESEQLGESSFSSALPRFLEETNLQNILSPLGETHWGLKEVVNQEPASFLNTTVDPSLLGGLPSESPPRLTSLSPPPQASRQTVNLILDPPRPTSDSSVLPVKRKRKTRLPPEGMEAYDEYDWVAPEEKVGPPNSKARKDKYGGKKTNRRRNKWPMTDTDQYCHHCRTKSFRQRMECRMCAKLFCIKCMYTWYVLLGAYMS
jgi:hypothetical protein